MASRASPGSDAATELRAGIAELHHAAHAWALTLCRRNADHAQDVLQESYSKIVDGRATFDGRSSLKTWLFGVIRFTALEHRRRRLVRRMGLLRLRAEPKRAGSPMPDEQTDASERSRALSDALRELADRQREVIHLVFYEDQTLQETSVTLGISIGSARKHYHRGKTRLLAALQRKGINI